ncbi:MAG: hypothetical protein IJ204_05690 [Paludibacteraceae bacterium]|nr:hypothetical protein [Paludibacteraceae bacterium]
MRRIVIYIGLVFAMTLYGQRWTSHFAYNNVLQIAVSPERVYAVSDGSLFSVDKKTEEIRVYNNQSGLHGTGITSIAYDQESASLIICYYNGKIDILSQEGVHYVSELYTKDMTQQKTIYNITIEGRTAYFSTHYGIQTFDLRTHRLVDSYWLRPNGTETPISDVQIANDSIYAFSVDSLYSAALTDNLVDYTYWHRELRSGRISPDDAKGRRYFDEADEWQIGYNEGIVRYTPTERLTYKPQGPLNNTPYTITAHHNSIWVVSGGRWASQNKEPGCVMQYDGTKWVNLPTDSIVPQNTGPVLDFMNVAVDPHNENHFFVTSYGTGLYEFEDGRLKHRYLAGEDTPLSSGTNNPANYTRLDCAHYDSLGNLWLVNASMVPYQLVCKTANGEWHGLPLRVGEEQVYAYTPGGLIIDSHHPNQKWLSTARYNTGLFLLNDNGTPFDPSDDRAVGRNEWHTADGKTFKAENLFCIMQDSQGRIWAGTDKGIVIIDNVDYFQSDLCLRPTLEDNNGEDPTAEQQITALCEDVNGNIWVGTRQMGVYILNAEATEILAHYTSDNTTMPSNGVLSIACTDNGIVNVGTGDGLAACDLNQSGEGLKDGSAGIDADGINQGYMQRWRLHYGYTDPHEVASGKQYIYACANGSLFAVDKSDGTITYWNKSNGLNGNSVSHIAYDSYSSQLVIAYDDGRIDLMTEDGTVRQMPDIYMKASSVAVDIRAIFCSKRYCYLAMPFGIVTINPKKAEVVDTYYIGEDAQSVDVYSVVELGDTLYALSDGYIYSAALSANLADYKYWNKHPLPTDRVQQAAVYKSELYMLSEGELYHKSTNSWDKISTDSVLWMHPSGGQLLLYSEEKRLYRLDEAHQPVRITNQYMLHDALCENGEYWLAEAGLGLVHLTAEGGQHYHPEGPNSNFAYSLTAAHNRIYSVVGGRWATQFFRPTSINIYDGTDWVKYDWWAIYTQTGIRSTDPVSVAVDPKDANHYFIATYTSGVFEFKRDHFVHYGPDNSTLDVALEGLAPDEYTRTDGVMVDDQGNLWVLNATSVGSPIHIFTPNGVWYKLAPYVSGKALSFITPKGIMVDHRDSHRKWMIEQRGETGIILLDDGGTPTYGGDDKCVKRMSFTDQNGNILTPDNYICMAQDLDNRIWIGTSTGIIVLPSSTDFFSSSECRRIIIPRNDGTNLGDYLLGDERINCLAVDGGNRMWIGTGNSGLYLMEDDTICVAHFTAENSLLPSNSIQSIAIMPATGEVFVGTDKGLASYRSDASQAQDDLKGAYAYPNPVRPDYGGMISIAGLMENTVVNIVDAGGNLVCKTKSHGGTAIWDGKLPDGRRATAGVYTALCNADGEHSVVKILVIH